MSKDYTDAAEEVARMANDLGAARVTPMPFPGHVAVPIEMLDELMEAVDAFHAVEHLIEEPGE